MFIFDQCSTNVKRIQKYLRDDFSKVFEIVSFHVPFATKSIATALYYEKIIKQLHHDFPFKRRTLTHKHQQCACSSASNDIMKSSMITDSIFMNKKKYIIITRVLETRFTFRKRFQFTRILIFWLRVKPLLPRAN